MEARYKITAYSTHKMDFEDEKKFEFTQFDSETGKIQVTCFNDYNVPMTGILYATFTTVRPGETEGYTYGGDNGSDNDIFDIVDNVITVTLPPGALFVPGRHTASIRVYGENMQALTVVNFTYNVKKDLIGEVPDDEQFRVVALTDLIEKTTDLQEQIPPLLDNLQMYADSEYVQIGAGIDPTQYILDIGALGVVKNQIDSSLSGNIILKTNAIYTLTSDVTLADNTVLNGNGATIQGDRYSLICGSNTVVKNCNFKVLTPRATPTTLLNQQAVTVVFKNASNCRIENCTGDGLVIAFDNVDGFFCRDNKFKGGHSYTAAYRRSSCQAINGSKNGVFARNKVSYSTGDGFHEDSSTDILWQENESFANGFTGFFTQYGSDLKFVRNIAHDHATYDGFDFNTAAYDAAAPTHPGLYSDKRNVEVEGNVSYNNKGAGIYITGSNFIVKSNFCYNNGSNGIRVVPTTGDNSYAANLLIQGNIAYNNNTGAYGNGTGYSHNITLMNVENSTIINNIAYQESGNIDKCIFISGRNNKVHFNNCYKSAGVTAPSTDLLQVTTDTGYYNSMLGNTGVNNRPKRNYIATFTNSWVNFGTAGANAYYSLNEDGTVSLGGLIASGTIGSAAFTLPPEARPAEKRFIGCVSLNGGTKVFGELDINTDGTVVPTTGGNTWFTLDNIKFSL